MPTMTINFHKAIVDTQYFGPQESTESFMRSEIHFTLGFRSRRFEEMKVTVSHPKGTEFQSAPLEVGPPEGEYSGPFNHAAFSEEAEKYYRSLVGPDGSAVRVKPEIEHVVFKGPFTLLKEVTVKFEVSEPSPAW